MISIHKEIEQKEIKRAQVQNALNTFNSENYLGYFQKEVEKDLDRLKRFEHLYETIKEEAVEEQNNYLRFEKHFFNDLEQIVIKKKMATAIRKGLNQ